MDSWVHVAVFLKFFKVKIVTQVPQSREYLNKTTSREGLAQYI